MSPTYAYPGFLMELKDALERELRGLGVRATVGFKRLGTTKVYRLYVISDGFKAWRCQDRQEHVWRIVGKHLGQPDLDRISMIVTATRAEVAGISCSSPSSVQAPVSSDSRARMSDGR